MMRIEMENIWLWWDDLTDDEKKEARLVLDVLSDKDNPKRAWLQVMVGYFGARFVKSMITIREDGHFKEE